MGREPAGGSGAPAAGQVAAFGSPWSSTTAPGHLVVIEPAGREAAGQVRAFGPASEAAGNGAPVVGEMAGSGGPVAGEMAATEKLPNGAGPGSLSSKDEGPAGLVAQQAMVRHGEAGGQQELRRRVRHGETGGQQELRRRVRLVVAYSGAGFHGFARQRGVPTVAGVLTEALEKVLRHPVELVCAGRTDAGVHAWGQVVSLDAAIGVELARVQRSVNAMLAPRVLVREAAWAPDGFDARRWALSRTYRYSVSCSKWPAPFCAGTTWHVGAALDVRAMQAACDPVLGEHDFSSFCRASGKPAGSTVRRVMAADWVDLGGDRLRFEIRAASFCQQMVRSLVGTMVEVGLGRRKAGEVAGVLAARDRSTAGPVAPAHGLCLWEVEYPAELAPSCSARG